MAQLTLQDLLAVKTKQELFTEFVALLSAVGFKGTDFTTFAIDRANLEIESDALEDLWVVVQDIAKGMHLDTAIKGWLTLKAKSDYQIDRVESEYTKGLEKLTLLPGAGPYTITAGDLLLSDSAGHFYRNTNATPVVLTTASPESFVEITATTPGAGSNVATNTITTVNEGSTGIQVNNIGIGAPATIVGTLPTLPLATNGKVLGIITNQGLVQQAISITFPSDYATLAAAVAGINGLIAGVQSPVRSFAKIVTVGPDQVLAMETTDTGGTVSIQLTGNARPELYLSSVATGFYLNDTPASISSAYQSGPFNILGQTLVLSFTESGTNYGNQSLAFTNNYNTIAAVADFINASPVFTVNGVRWVTASDQGGRLILETIKQGGAIAMTIVPSTVNITLGLPLTTQTSVGKSGWLTQEGRDEEDDESLRLRCKSKWGILGAGTRDAFLTWTKEATIKAQKVVVYANLFNGVAKPGAVSIYVGALTGGIDNATVTEIYNYILPKLPIMSDLYVSSVNTRPVVYSGVVTIESAFNNAGTRAAIRNNIALYSQSLQIKETVYKRKIERQILLVPGVVDVVLATPTANTTVALNEVGVITEDLINPLIFRVV